MKIPIKYNYLEERYGLKEVNRTGRHVQFQGEKIDGITVRPARINSTGIYPQHLYFLIGKKAYLSDKTILK